MEEQRTVFQKTVLVILAVMILIFAVITAFNQTRPGIEFRDGFLQKIGVTDADGFSGKVEGREVTLLRYYNGWDDADPNTTCIRLILDGWTVVDYYSVYLGEPVIPPAEISTGNTPLWNDILTLRITKNDQVIYEGGYRKESGIFFTSDGELSALSGDGTTYVSGADPWADYTIPKGTLVKLALGPELATRGDWRLYGLMVFLTLLMMADVAFPYTLFRWRYRRVVKNPKPTDDYMSMQHLSWVFLPMLLLVGYIWAATTTIAVV